MDLPRPFQQDCVVTLPPPHEQDCFVRRPRPRQREAADVGKVCDEESAVSASGTSPSSGGPPLAAPASPQAFCGLVLEDPDEV